MRENYPVIILCAGEGSRMSKNGSWTQKALFPLERRSLVSHILERFPSTSPIILATGYKGQDVEDYWSLRYGQSRIVRYVNVPRLTGPGSGPGRSTLECLKEIDTPFFLACCDTLWSEPLPQFASQNWIGVGSVPPEEVYRYCMVEEQSGSVVRLIDKPTEPIDHRLAFNGLAFIYDIDLFKEGLQRAVDSNVEVQISHGLNEIIASKSLSAQFMPSWCDLGTEANYQSEKIRRRDNSTGDKDGEFLFHEEGSIIKAFCDERRARERAQRAERLPGLIPSLVKWRGKFLSYSYQPGKVLSEGLSSEKIKDFLMWCKDRLWTQVCVSQARQKEAGRRFYHDETMDRVRATLESRADHAAGVPESECYEEFFRHLPWDYIASIVPVRFHGDLQTENILMTPNSGYCLLDWRENFGGEIDFGDLYYDLAKLHASLFIDFNHLMTKGLVTGVLPERMHGTSLCSEIKLFCLQESLDYSKVLLIEKIIFIRMSALHHSPLKEVLWQHGLNGLSRTHKKNNIAR